MKLKALLRSLLALSILTLTQVVAWSTPRTAEHAAQEAARFWLSLGTGLRSSQIFTPNLAYAIPRSNGDMALRTATINSEEATGENYLYIFNQPNDGGFIIVSGDDRLPTIVGYATNGRLDLDNAPCNLRAFMQTVLYHIESVLQNPLSIPLQKNVIGNPTIFAGGTVEPLLGNIKWNQTPPWNSQCPENGYTRAYVGCVATAVAQIMRYYKWPESGVGKVIHIEKADFNPRKGRKHEVDFSQQTYKWDLMPEEVNHTHPTTPEQNAELGKICYHVGVAGKMEYLDQVSGTYSEDMAEGIREHFRYSRAMQVVKRNRYSDESWNALVKSEIDKQRPVYYAGYGGGMGHAFVVDGYNDKGLFHVNWGWGGQSDGYFRLDLLSPDGLGAGAGGGNYNDMQEIIVNLEPDRDNSSQYAPAELYNISFHPTVMPEKNRGIHMTNFALGNFGITKFEGKMALAMEEYETGKLHVSRTATIQVPLIARFQQKEWQDGSFPKMTDLDNLPDGRYILRAVYQVKGSDKWLPVVPYLGTESFARIEIIEGQWHLHHSTMRFSTEDPSGRMFLMDFGLVADAELTGVKWMKLNERYGWNQFRLLDKDFAIAGAFQKTLLFVGKEIAGMGISISEANLSEAYHLTHIDLCNNHMSKEALHRTILSLPYIEQGPGVAPREIVVKLVNITSNKAIDHDFAFLAKAKGWKVKVKAVHLQTQTLQLHDYFALNTSAQCSNKTAEVTLDTSANGTATIEGAANLAEVPFGTVLTVKAQPAEGYIVESIKVDDADITFSRRFVPYGKQTVKVTFAKYTPLAVDTVDTNSRAAIWPNPATSQLQIHGLAGDKILMYSLNGELVWQAQLPASGSMVHSVGDLPRGQYLVRIGGKTHKIALN